MSLHLLDIYLTFNSVFANGLVSGALAVGSIIGPQTFRAKDAPQYMPAKIIVLATQAAAVMIAVIARVYYGYQNSRKEKEMSSTHIQVINDIEWLNCKQNSTWAHLMSVDIAKLFL